ncbi:MAG: ferredoxin--NADP reductase [Bryobacteraceae bacterium]
MHARLIKSREIVPEVRHFVFDVPAADRLEFTPGQFVSFSQSVLGRLVTRAYSIASAPAGSLFELVLNRVKDGIFSPWLFEMKPGDTVEMQGPLGYFVPRVPFHDSVFVATGTGIAPFRSYLQWQPIIESENRITLLFGARYEEGLIYRGEFETIERTRPGFRFLPTITRPDAGWPGRTGWVQQHLDEALEGRLDVDVYVCGLKAMADDVRAILKRKGLTRQQIRYEKYD